MRRTENTCTYLKANKGLRGYTLTRFHAYTPTRLHALTLIELVIVCAIIAVLAGIVWVVYHSIKERGKVVVCVSNLRQIGIALTAYREDHDGLLAEEGKENEWWELGLPPPGFSAPIPSLVPQYAPSDKIFYCTNPPVSQVRGIPFEATNKYWYQVWSDNDPIPFREAVKLRGEEYPIMVDPRHYDRGYDEVMIFGRWAIVLRLNQKIERSETIGRASIDW